MSGDGGQNSWDEGPGTPSLASSPVGSHTGSQTHGEEEIMSEFRCGGVGLWILTIRCPDIVILDSVIRIIIIMLEINIGGLLRCVCCREALIFHTALSCVDVHVIVQATCV